MWGEQFFYWYGVFAAIVSIPVVVWGISLVPVIIYALLGRSLGSLQLWWEKLNWDGKDDYQESRESGTWQYRINRVFVRIRTWNIKIGEGYMDVMDSVYEKVPKKILWWM